MGCDRRVLKPFLMLFYVLKDIKRVEGSRGEVGHLENETVLVDLVWLFLSEILLYSVYSLEFLVIVLYVFEYFSVRFLVYKFKLILF